jgi:hypothetical protein
MWAIFQNFQLGKEKHPANYLAGTLVSDDEWTEEIRNSKLIPNGWIQYDPGVSPEKVEQKQYFAKEPYGDPA